MKAGAGDHRTVRWAKRSVPTIQDRDWHLFSRPTTSNSVVPANAGTHTPRSIFFIVASRPSFKRNSGGYGSLRSQGRRRRVLWPVRPTTGPNGAGGRARDVGDAIGCRPCERRDPYRVIYRERRAADILRKTKAGGYGSLRSQGRRAMGTCRRPPRPLSKASPPGS